MSDVLRVTELGIERRCNVCGEWWPHDREFYHLAPKGLRGFKAICRACEGEGTGRARLDDAVVVAMLRAGRTVPDIALTLGCSRGAVYKRRKAYRERVAA